MTRLFLQPNKYRNVHETYNGVTYHSKREAAYARELDLRLRARGKDRIQSWRRQVKISLDVDCEGRLLAFLQGASVPNPGPLMHICNYFVDFELTHTDGSIELVEIKGMETDVYKLKRKLLEATFLKAHPEVTYTVIK